MSAVRICKTCKCGTIIIMFIAASDERVARGRRSARLKMLGLVASFCVAGLGSIVASVLVILKEKDLDEDEKLKVEIVQYGGICGGILVGPIIWNYIVQSKMFSHLKCTFRNAQLKFSKYREVVIIL